MTSRRGTTGLLMTIAAVSALAAGCGADDGDGTAKDAGKPATTPATTTYTNQSPTSGDLEVDISPTTPHTIEITVRDGRVTGGVKTHKVPVGEPVTILVDADVRDEVHLHGIDVKEDVAPDDPATITTVPEAPGQYELELESSHTPIGVLQVQPS